MGDYLGILLNDNLHHKISKQLNTCEGISFYEEACDQFDLTLCFFRIRDIEVGKNEVTVLIKSGNGGYSMNKVMKPKVIHNRGFYSNKKDREKIKSLQRDGLIIFNGCTGYQKLKIHKILIENKTLSQHLPKTLIANKTNFLQMVKRHKNLIIKPDNGSLGMGIIMVSKKSTNLWNFNNGKRAQLFSINKQWPKELEKIISKLTNIIQQRIPLATYKGNPFDLRVSVQRKDIGEWQVTGMVAKVAK
ncbi:MAG: YheC/YheD family protein [Bacillota bacterium]